MEYCLGLLISQVYHHNVILSHLRLFFFLYVTLTVRCRNDLLVVFGVHKRMRFLNDTPNTLQLC